MCDVYCRTSTGIKSHHIRILINGMVLVFSWWRHQMETFSALLALCAGNSPVTGEFPAQRPVTRSFGDFFDLRLNKRLSKHSWGGWFGTPSPSLWRHCNVVYITHARHAAPDPPPPPPPPHTHTHTHTPHMHMIFLPEGWISLIQFWLSTLWRGHYYHDVT